jgi:PAS domain S-box-containing protein
MHALRRLSDRQLTGEMVDDSGNPGIAPVLTLGDGEMSRRIHAHDWQASPLGPPERWPQVLRTLTELMLASSQPMFIVWGRERTTIYNDAYSEILGGKHPVLGQPFERIWREIWESDLEGLVTRAYAGEAIHMDDIPLQMIRSGVPEETHFSFSYTPVRDETGAVKGFFCACLEITEQVLEERRARLRAELTEALRDLTRPGDIARAAADLLRHHFGATQTLYGEIDPAGRIAILDGGRSDGAPRRRARRRRIDDFGLDLANGLRAGRSIAIADVRDDPRVTSRKALANFAAYGLRSFLCVPHLRDGRLAAAIAVLADAPRLWRPGDLALAEEVAQRVHDALERVRAEAALRHSERRAGRVVESIADGLMTFDRNWRITFINHRGEDLVRSLTGPAEQLLGRDFWEAFPTVDAAPYAADFRRAMDERVMTSVEAYYAPLDRWFYTRCYPLGDGLAMYFLDVTDRKRAEEELRQAHALLEGVAQGTQDLIAALDRDFRVLFCNEAYRQEYRRLWGHEIGVGQHLLEPLAAWPDEQRKARAIWSRALAGETFRETMDFGPSAAARRIYDLRFSPVRDREGRLIGAAHIFRDITDQKRLEIALRKSESRFRALVTSSSSGIFRTSPDWSEMHHLDGRDGVSDTPAARRDWMDDHVHPEDRPAVAATVAEAARAGTTVEFEHRVLRPDGSTGWVHTRAVPLLGDNGEVVEWFGAASDITERKQAEQRQSMLMAELDHRVKNVLAVVQSIARHSLRDGGDVSREVTDRLIGRISALAQSHRLLASGRWEGTHLGEIAEAAVAPYRGENGERIRLGGPGLKVTPKAAQTLALALHELVTNAAKHGALSRAGGRVAAEWQLTGSSDDRRLRFVWSESGGPALDGPPRRKGFGSVLIEQTLGAEFDGEVRLDYAPGGLRAEFDLPLDRLRA